MPLKLFRSDYWPGLPPTKEPRKLCSDCKFHVAAMAGWQWDRCYHQEADYGSVVRNDQKPTCSDVRLSTSECGQKANWFEPKEQISALPVLQLPMDNESALYGDWSRR